MTENKFKVQFNPQFINVIFCISDIINITTIRINLNLH